MGARLGSEIQSLNLQLVRSLKISILVLNIYFCLIRFTLVLSETWKLLCIVFTYAEEILAQGTVFECLFARELQFLCALW